MLNTFLCLSNICTGMGGENVFFHLLGGEKVLGLCEYFSLVVFI